MIESSVKIIFLLKLSRKKVNYRYGAWYLPREFWKCPANEKIVDPKQKTDPEKEEAKRKVEEMVILRINLHSRTV